MKKRIVSLLIALALVCSFGSTAFAQDLEVLEETEAAAVAEPIPVETEPMEETAQPAAGDDDFEMPEKDDSIPQTEHEKRLQMIRTFFEQHSPTDLPRLAGLKYEETHYVKRLPGYNIHYYTNDNFSFHIDEKSNTFIAIIAGDEKSIFTGGTKDPRTMLEYFAPEFFKNGVIEDHHDLYDNKKFYKFYEKYDSTRITERLASLETNSNGNFVTLGFNNPPWDVNPQEIPGPIQPVKSLTAKSAGYDSVKLQWTAAKGAIRYDVSYSTSKNGPFIQALGFAIGEKNTSFTVSRLKTGQTYYFRVLPMIQPDSVLPPEILHSDLASATPVTAAPASTKAKAVGSNKIKVTWKAPKGATGYYIFRSASKNGGYKKIKTITNGKTVSFTNRMLSSGKTYYYKVRSFRLVSGKRISGKTSGAVRARAYK